MSNREVQAQSKAPGRVFWLGAIAAALSIPFLLFPDLPKSIDVAFSAMLLVGLVSVLGELRKQGHTPRALGPCQTTGTLGKHRDRPPESMHIGADRVIE